MYPSTFLELCQRTARECGVAGTGPSKVTEQIGELDRIIDWVKSAYLDIQALHVDWDWMWGESSFLTVAGTDVYATPFVDNDIRALDGTATLHDTAVGATDKTRLREMPYRQFRERYLTVDPQSARPTVITTKPNESAFQLYPIPNKEYTVTYAYWRDTHQLSANSDTVLIPSKHVMVIVYRATMLYAQYEEATNLYQTAEANYFKALGQLEESHLPKRIFKMRPLA